MDDGAGDAAVGEASRAGPVARAPLAPDELLTARERTIVELLPTYLTYEQIAARLSLSVNTVKSNLKSIYRKLAATTRSEAVDAAMAAGLVRVGTD